MSQTGNGQGYVGRGAAWALLGVLALLVGSVMLATTAFAADEPTTTLGAEAPTTTVAPDPPAQTGDPATPPVTDPPVGAALVTTFSRAFSNTAIAPDGVTTLTFTIAVDAATTGLTFAGDTLPAGVKVAPAPNKSTTCTDPGGATFTATAGQGSIIFSGWDLATGSCTVKVDVTSATPGSHAYAAATTLNSSATPVDATGASTLFVMPKFSKVFSPASIAPGGISTLTYTIDNTGNPSQVAALAFTDALPSGVTISANPPTAPSTQCTGGTLTAVAGTTTITYSGGTVALQASCTVSVNVTSTTVGTYPSTSGALSAADPTGATVSAGTATATLTVAAAAATVAPVSETPAAALAITGGPKTGLLAGIGFGVLLLGALLVLGSSQRRRLARR